MLTVPLNVTKPTTVVISPVVAQVNMITPMPVEIGAKMTVRCAASTVGGVQVFKDLTKHRDLSRIDLKVSETELWASYTPGEVYPERVKVSN